MFIDKIINQLKNNNKQWKTHLRYCKLWFLGRTINVTKYNSQEIGTGRNAQVKYEESSITPAKIFQ